MKLFKTIGSVLLSILKFASKHQLNLQSMILWLMALVNLGKVEFWFFAIPAILIGGLGDILDEVRKLNQTNKEDESED